MILFIRFYYKIKLLQRRLNKRAKTELSRISNANFSWNFRGIILFSWIEFFSRFHFDFVISRKKISLEIGSIILLKLNGKEFVRRGVNISIDFRLIITWERNFFYPAIINNSWAGSPRRKEQHPDDHWERKIASRGADSCWN